MLIHPHQMEDALAQINADHSHFHMGSSVNRLLHDLPLPSEDQAADHPINIGQASWLRISRSLRLENSSFWKGEPG
jgi:hypothetical protein